MKLMHGCIKNKVKCYSAFILGLPAQAKKPGK
jgi:hypothetical protein